MKTLIRKSIVALFLLLGTLSLPCSHCYAKIAIMEKNTSIDPLQRHEPPCRFKTVSSHNELQPAWIGECQGVASDSSDKFSANSSYSQVEMSAKIEKVPYEDFPPDMALGMFSPDHQSQRHEIITELFADSERSIGERVLDPFGFYENYPPVLLYRRYSDPYGSEPEPTGWGNYALSIPLSIVPGFGLGQAVQGRWSGPREFYTLVDGIFVTAVLATCVRRDLLRMEQNNGCDLAGMLGLFFWLPTKLWQIADTIIMVPKLEGWWVEQGQPGPKFSIGVVDLAGDGIKNKLGFGIRLSWSPDK